MNYIFRSKIILLLVLLLAGCGYKQTTTQSRDVGYLKFDKSMDKEYSVVINNKYTFKLDACLEKNENNQCINSTFNKLYEVSSGNVVIEVFSNDKLIMRKESYIGSSNTLEVKLP